MATPIRSDAAASSITSIEPVHQTSFQFKDFGVLDTGKQSKASTATSVVVNLVLIGLAVFLGTMAKRTLDEQKRVTMLTMPVVIKPVEPPPPPKVIPRPLPVPVVKVDPPKIKLPEVKPIEVPKPAEVKMTQPAPIVKPAPPLKVVAPPAPQVVNLARPMAASVVNTSQHPTAVALGSPNHPLTPTDRTGPANVDLGQRGMAGMPKANTGGGPASQTVNLGSGSPGSQTLAGNGARPVQGVKLGVVNGTGPMNSTGRTAGQVNLGQVQQVALPKPAAQMAPGVAQNTPKVLFKPKPAYTPEATALHINGIVQVRIRVSSTGSVTVLAVTRPLGHGLDQSAARAAESMRFQPAVDANGRPVDWEGNVTVTFQTESNG